MLFASISASCVNGFIDFCVGYMSRCVQNNIFICGKNFVRAYITNHGREPKVKSVLSSNSASGANLTALVIWHKDNIITGVNPLPQK
jgi:hypothetical protein